MQGDDFGAEVTAELIGQSASSVVAALSGSLARQHHLVRPEGLQRLGGEHSPPRVRSTYRFTHHLFHKYIYESLDKVERSQLHAAIAGILVRDLGDDQAERERLAIDLARHYEAGGMPLQAARALHDAGRQAMRMSALREALDLFERGLAMLERVPPSPERAEIERLLQVDRLGPQASVDGSGSKQLAGASARAVGAGQADGRLRLLLLEADVNLLASSGRFEEALAAAAQIQDGATCRGDEVFAALADFWTGLVHHLAGRPQQAENDFERAIGRLTPERGAELRAATGFDLAPIVLSFSAINRWILGYPESAALRCSQALSTAMEENDTLGKAFSAGMGCLLFFFLRGDDAVVQEQAERGRQICQQARITWWQDYIEVFLGWQSIVRGDGDGDAAVGWMRRAIADWQAKSGDMGVDGLLVVLTAGCLTEARRRSPDDHEARGRLLGLGLAASEPFLGRRPASMQTFQAELLRMQGELLLERDGLGAAGEARACFDRALQVGRAQGAPVWELRAAMSLVRLLQRQAAGCASDLAGARRLLREVYGRFTEGFGFPDLQDAARLLDEASGAPPQ